GAGPRRRSGLRLVLGAGRHARLPSALDARDALGREGDDAEAGLGLALADGEHALDHAPADGAVLVVLAPPADRPEERVVEAPTPFKVAHLDRDVVDHHHKTL